MFGCEAYIFLPEEVKVNKLAPKSELMTFIGYSDGVKGYLFMRSPNNVVFTAIKALFSETMFPKCPEMQRQGFTPTGDQPSDDSNIPPEDDGHNNSNVDDDDLFPSPAPENWCAPAQPPPPPGDAPIALEDSDSDGENWLEQAERDYCYECPLFSFFLSLSLCFKPIGLRRYSFPSHSVILRLPYAFSLPHEFYI